MSLFKNPSELATSKTIKMLIYGQPGIGKSTIALSAPMPVLLDFDGGISRVNKAFQCPTVEVKSWEEANDAISELEQGGVPFRTVVIDTAGKMLDFMSDYIMREDSRMKMRDGSLSLKGYGVRKRMFVDMLRRISLMGSNVVFIAHEKEDRDGETRIVRPDMGGSALGDLIKELDLVGYMQAIGTERTIAWNPQEKFYAKNCCNLPPMEKVPTVVDADGKIIGTNTFLTSTFEKYDNYLKQQANVRKDYDELLARISAIVNAVNDLNTANEARNKLAELNAIWDSKVQAGTRLNAKCKTLGIIYDKTAGAYVQV